MANSVKETKQLFRKYIINSSEVMSQTTDIEILTQKKSSLEKIDHTIFDWSKKKICDDVASRRVYSFMLIYKSR